MWEPVLGRLIAIHERDDLLPRIEEIWSLDNVTNGDSAILNEGYNGPLGALALLRRLVLAMLKMDPALRTSIIFSRRLA